MPRFFEEKNTEIDNKIDIDLDTDRVIVKYRTYAFSGLLCYDLTPTFLIALLDYVKNVMTGSDALHNVFININVVASKREPFHDSAMKLTLEKAHDFMENAVKTYISNELKLRTKNSCTML